MTLQRFPLTDLTNRNDGTKRSIKRPCSQAADEQSHKRPCIESLLCTEDSLPEPPLASDSELSDIECKDVFTYPSISDSDSDSAEGEDDHMFDLKNMRSRDQLYRPKANIWAVQKEIRPDMRATLIDWLYEVADNFGLQRETSMIAINYIDRFLAIEVISTERLQLLGITCLFIAMKFQEIVPVGISTMASLCDDDMVNEDAILEMEVIITGTLEWNLSPPTAFTWLRMYLEECSRSDDSPFPYPVLIHATQLIEYLHMHPSSTIYSAGVIAASGFCLYAARNDRMEEVKAVTGFSELELKPCLTLLAQMEGLFEDEEFKGRISLAIEKKGDEQIHNPIALEYVRSLFCRSPAQ